MRENVFSLLMDKENGSGSGGGGSGHDERIGDDPRDETSSEDTLEENSSDGDESEAVDEDDDDIEEVDEDADLDEDEDDDGEDKKKKKSSRSDDRDLISRIAQGVAAGMHARRPQDTREEKRLTDAEVKKLLNTYEIDEDTIRDALDLDKDVKVGERQIKAFQKLVSGILKNSTSIAQVNQTATIRKLEERLSQYDAFMAEARQEQAQTRFFRQYPYLQKYDKIVGAVATNFAENDPDWGNTSFEEGARKVAKEVRRILKDSGIKLSKPKPEGEANHGADDQEVRPGRDRVPEMSRSMGSGRSSTQGKGGRASNVDADVYGQGNANW